MQEPRDSFSNHGENNGGSGPVEEPAAATGYHSRQSSRPLEGSGSLIQEEFGSAEAMEYTPSNTSQNNSIPGQLVTHSNSNLNLSQGKAGSSMIYTGNGNSQSPSPYHMTGSIDQSTQQHRLSSFKAQQQTSGTNNPQNRLDFYAGQVQQNGANSLMTQDPNIQSMVSQPTNNTAQGALINHPQHQVEDDFFDQHASLLMQQQRSASKQTATQNQQQTMQQVQFGVAQSQNSVVSPAHLESSSMQIVSQSTTPGFQHGSRQEMTGQGNPSDQAQSQQIQVQNFSINSQQQLSTSQQLQNPPLVTSQKRILPHQTISLMQQKNQQQQVNNQQYQTQPNPITMTNHGNNIQAPDNASVLQKLQQKVQQQAQRLQAEAQYRLLCEKRIKKLDPMHPLPLQFEHLERDHFTPQQIQTVYVAEKQQQQMANGVQLEQNRQLVQHLQARVTELNKQVNDRQFLEQRLKQAEESLRAEVLSSEEQRAYIEMLKNQLDVQIKTMGLTFDADVGPNKSLDYSRTSLGQRPSSRQSNGSSSGVQNRSKMSLAKSNSNSRQIDGLIQLSSLKKACEDLKLENDILKAKIEQGNQNLTVALSEQRDAFNTSIEQLQNDLHKEVQIKNQLNDKNETLMQYAKENIDTAAGQSNQLEDLDRRRQHAESQASEKHDRADQLEKELSTKQALLDQLKNNLEEMRAEKIKTQAHLQTLEKEKTVMQRRIDLLQGDNLNEVKALGAKVAEKEAQLMGLQERMHGKEDLLKNTETRLESAIKSEMTLKQQLSTELARAQTADASNFNLKHTLVDSQLEMDTLVNKYDQAVEDLIKRDQKINKLTDDLLQVNRETEKLYQTNTETQALYEKQKQEIFDVYSSLRRKEEVLRNMEDRLNRKLSDKDDHCLQLQSKLTQMEQTFSHETNNIEHLRRMCDQKTEVGVSLENTLMAKDNQLREMQQETAKIRLAGERAYREREEELLQQLQQKTTLEYRLTQESEKMVLQVTELQEQAQSAQKVTDEMKTKVQDLELDVRKKEQARLRWEDEVKRLQSGVESKSTQHEDLLRDYERIRQQQIDDAMLIDRMRIAQGDMKDQVNEIVGKITHFGYNLEEIGQSNLSNDLESAYEISKRIVPVTQDVLPALEYISNFIRPISNDVVTRLQNVPERDSDKRSQQDTLNHTNEQQFSANQSNYEYKSNNFSRNQQQASNFTLMSQQLNNAVMMSMQGIPDSTVNDSIPRCAHNITASLNQPSVVQSSVALQHEINSIDSQTAASEVQALKNQVTQLEQASLLDQEEKQDLEEALKIVLQISTLANSFKLLLQQLHLKIRDTNKARRDKYAQSTKVLQMEQRYHFQSKMALSQTVSIEMTMLKQGIVRERGALHDLELVLQDQVNEQKRIIEDVIRTNAFASDTGAETSLKIKKLQDLYEEARIQRQELQEQLEWTQTLLSEQKSLHNRFASKPRGPSGDRNSRSRDPSNDPSRGTGQLAGRDACDSSARQSEADAQQSVFKSYLPPPSNGKTEQALKSEEFNRKQIINSAREHYEQQEAQQQQQQQNNKFNSGFRGYTAEADQSDVPQLTNLNTAQPRSAPDYSVPKESPATAYTQQQQFKDDPPVRNDRSRSSLNHHSQIGSQISNMQRGRTDGSDRPQIDPCSRALRNRSKEGSASLERSKSPKCSQASNIIRRKYSQLQTSRVEDAREYNDSYGAMVSPIRTLDRASEPQLTINHLQNIRPLRRSPERSATAILENNKGYDGKLNSSQQSLLHQYHPRGDSRSPTQREQNVINELSAADGSYVPTGGNQFKRN